MSTRSNTSFITTSNLYKDEHSAAITKVQMMEITPSSLIEPQLFFFLVAELEFLVGVLHWSNFKEVIDL